MVPQVRSSLTMHLQSLTLPRCTAHSSNLDATPSPPRSQIWTDHMVEHLKKKEVWDDCGINPDVIVSEFTLSQHAITLTVTPSHSQATFRMQISTSSYRVTSCTKLLKGLSKTTSSRGLGNTLTVSTGSRRLQRSWLILIDGMRCDSPMHPHSPPNSISVAPPYPGLRRFKQGRGFSQWTGNDSRALMKVWRCSATHVCVNNTIFRSICQRSKDTYQTTW